MKIPTTKKKRKTKMNKNLRKETEKLSTKETIGKK
jgi:hypothetical protein